MDGQTVNILPSVRHVRSSKLGWVTKGLETNIPADQTKKYSVLFFSRPQQEGCPHHGRTFSIYLCPLSSVTCHHFSRLLTEWGTALPMPIMVVSQSIRRIKLLLTHVSRFPSGSTNIRWVAVRYRVPVVGFLLLKRSSNFTPSTFTHRVTTQCISQQSLTLIATRSEDESR